MKYRLSLKHLRLRCSCSVLEFIEQTDRLVARFRCAYKQLVPKSSLGQEWVARAGLQAGGLGKGRERVRGAKKKDTHNPQTFPPPAGHCKKGGLAFGFQEHCTLGIAVTNI